MVGGGVDEPAEDLLEPAPVLGAVEEDELEALGGLLEDVLAHGLDEQVDHLLVVALGGLELLHEPRDVVGPLLEFARLLHLLELRAELDVAELIEVGAALVAGETDATEPGVVLDEVLLLHAHPGGEHGEEAVAVELGGDGGHAGVLAERAAERRGESVLGLDGEGHGVAHLDVGAEQAVAVGFFGDLGHAAGHDPEDLVGLGGIEDAEHALIDALELLLVGREVTTEERTHHGGRRDDEDTRSDGEEAERAGGETIHDENSGMRWSN